MSLSVAAKHRSAAAATPAARALLSTPAAGSTAQIRSQLYAGMLLCAVSTAKSMHAAATSCSRAYMSGGKPATGSAASAPTLRHEQQWIFSSGSAVVQARPERNEHSRAVATAEPLHAPRLCVTAVARAAGPSAVHVHLVARVVAGFETSSAKHACWVGLTCPSAGSGQQRVRPRARTRDHHSPCTSRTKTQSRRPPTASRKSFLPIHWPPREGPPPRAWQWLVHRHPRCAQRMLRSGQARRAAEPPQLAHPPEHMP